MPEMFPRMFFRSSHDDVIEARKTLEDKIARIEKLLENAPAELKKLQADLYSHTIREAHIKEIYRLAEEHFPRLHRTKELTEADIQEIEKWVGRAKSADGLVVIVEAVRELEKYSPVDIRRNLYALVQKIILGGAYKEKSRR